MPVFNLWFTDRLKQQSRQTTLPWAALDQQCSQVNGSYTDDFFMWLIPSFGTEDMYPVGFCVLERCSVLTKLMKQSRS